MSTGTPLATSSSLAGVLEALRTVHVDATTWTARVGPRELPGGTPTDLRPRLVGAMYEVLHAGRAEEKDLGRITRESDVEQILASGVAHRATPRRARVLRTEDDGGAVVHLGDVRVRLPADLVPPGTEAGQVADLRLPAARPGLSHGFYLVDGPRGSRTPEDEGLCRLYVHALTPEAAAAVWHRALAVLDAAEAPYRTKALSHRDGYPRRDAVVVYLPSAHAYLAHDVADAVSGTPHLGEDVSAFASRIAPGVAIADEPRDPRPRYRGLSFGEHRCTVAAAALLRAAERPGTHLADLLAEECRRAGVDPSDLAFNRDHDAHDERTTP